MDGIENTLENTTTRTDRGDSPEGGSRWYQRRRPVPNTRERLRDHPELDHCEFSHHDAAGTRRADHEVLRPCAIPETEREPNFRRELLRMFRQRLHLLATLALLMLPWSTFLYIYLVPTDENSSASTSLAWRQILITQFTLFFITAMVQALARRTKILFQARFLSFLLYVAFAVGTAVIAIFTGAAAISNESMILGEANIVVYGGFNQILLSVLLLPYSVWESLAVSVLVLATVLWSLWWALPPGFQYLFYPHFFVIFTTALAVLCIAYYQDILRQRAFASSFDLARSAAQLQILSTLDAVTGGFNRIYLEKMLDIEIARAVRHARPLSVLMFDLDNFKCVNDTSGHAAGDEALREVWRAAASVVREIDTVARYGGDEFIIVLPETDQRDAHAVAERLRGAAAARLRERFGSYAAAGHVTLSIGLLTLQLTTAVSLDEVMKRVDDRLYEAKRHGKNRIVM